MLPNKCASTIASSVPVQGYSDETTARTSDLQSRSMRDPSRIMNHPFLPLIDLQRDFRRLWHAGIETRANLQRDRVVSGAIDMLSRLATRHGLVLVSLRRSDDALLDQIRSLRLEPLLRRQHRACPIVAAEGRRWVWRSPNAYYPYGRKGEVAHRKFGRKTP